MKSLITIGALLFSTLPWSATAVDWQVDLKELNENNLHWSTPSYIVFRSNGEIELYAEHLANMQRTSYIFDTGDYLCAFVELDFYSNQDCTGSVLEHRRMVFKCLNYKEEVNNFKTKIFGARDLFERANCVRPTQVFGEYIKVK